eukprot:scaffold43977_cov26-Prasinocladus_malaysianus.AAC.2
MADGLGASMDALVASVPPTDALPHLSLLLVECCKDASPDVRQSAFALVGDLAKHTQWAEERCCHWPGRRKIVYPFKSLTKSCNMDAMLSDIGCHNCWHDKL